MAIGASQDLAGKLATIKEDKNSDNEDVDVRQTIAGDKDEDSDSDDGAILDFEGHMDDLFSNKHVQRERHSENPSVRRKGMSNMVQKQRADSNVSAIEEEAPLSDESSSDNEAMRRQKTLGLNLLEIEAAKGAMDDDSFEESDGSDSDSAFSDDATGMEKRLQDLAAETNFSKMKLGTVLRVVILNRAPPIALVEFNEKQK